MGSAEVSNGSEPTCDCWIERWYAVVSTDGDEVAVGEESATGAECVRLWGLVSIKRRHEKWKIILQGNNIKFSVAHSLDCHAPDPADQVRFSSTQRS